MLGGSIRVGRILGSEVRLHNLFLMFAAFMTASAGMRGGVEAGLWQAITMAAVFGSVLLHEYGHASAARLFGISTPEIVIYPFGGVAFLDTEPRSAFSNLVIAVAGPAVSATIAGVLALAGFWKEGLVEPNTVSGLLEFLIFCNLGLLLLNLIPAFPLDGGQVLRSILWMMTSERLSLLIAVAAGQIIAVLMLAAAILLVLPMMGVIAVLVFFVSAMMADKHPFWLIGFKRKDRSGETPVASQ